MGFYFQTRVVYLPVLQGWVVQSRRTLQRNATIYEQSYLNESFKIDHKVITRVLCPHRFHLLITPTIFSADLSSLSEMILGAKHSAVS